MRLSLIISAIALLLLGAYIFTGQKVVPVKTTKVKRASIEEFIEEEGKTYLKDIRTLSMPAAGRILPIKVEEGDKVKKGEVVAQMDLADLKTRVESLEAQKSELEATLKEHRDDSIEKAALNEAEKSVEALSKVVKSSQKQVKLSLARWKDAAKRLERAKKLYKNKTISREEYDDASLRATTARLQYQQNLLFANGWETGLIAFEFTPVAIRNYLQKKVLREKVISRQIRRLKVELDNSRYHLKRGTIASPLDGTVLRRHITGSRELSVGTPLLEMGNLKALEVRVPVLTEEIGKIEVGNPVKIFPRALGEEFVWGKVNKIYPQAFTKVSSLGVEQQRVYVIISFDELKDQGRYGVDFRVYVHMIHREKKGVLLVPRTALFRSPQGQWQVFVIEGGSARKKTVKTGLINDRRAEIVKGLEEGEEVVDNPSSDLAEGVSVEVEKR